MIREINTACAARDVPTEQHIEEERQKERNFRGAVPESRFFTELAVRAFNFNHRRRQNNVQFCLRIDRSETSALI